jgi:16S rRNA processing protein RimM
MGVREDHVRADVHLGRFVKPVGLRGELKLAATADFWDEALASAELQLETAGATRPVRVVGARMQAPGTYVLHLADVGDRDAAQALVGADLWLAAGATDVPEPAELRPFQVRGLRVLRADGAPVGEVVDLEALPGQRVLVVQAGERRHLIPMVPSIVLAVDREAGEVRIDPPPGLLELSA